jgi:HEAT repeat protein
MEITGAEGLDSRVFVHLTEIGLVQALRELLSRFNYAFFTGAAGPASAQGSRLIVFNRVSERDALGKIIDSTESDALDSADPPTVADPQVKEAQEKLARIEASAKDGDLEALRNGLQDSDPVIQAAAFEALAAQDQDAAVESLLAAIKDTNQPSRLQALQMLDTSPEADSQTVLAVLRDALQDPDPLFRAHAVQALAGRGDADAMDALSEAFHGADPSTRVLVLEGVAQSEAGLLLLPEALSDSDETVRSAAATLIQNAEVATDAAGNP